MGQQMNSKQQRQDQSGMNQSGNQGTLNHRQGGYGGSTNDNLPQQGGPDEQSSIGSQNQADNAQRSQGKPTGQPEQSQGNLDTQGKQNIGQRGDSQFGAGQQNESVEQPSRGTSVNQR